MISLIMTMMWVYPYFTYWSRQKKDQPGYQLLVIVLLAMTRRTFKKIMNIQCQLVHRPAPFFSVAYINAFHVVYLSIVLQQNDGMISLFAVMIFDTSGNICALRGMNKVQNN